jgi:hypothetical protein
MDANAIIYEVGHDHVGTITPNRPANRVNKTP